MLTCDNELVVKTEDVPVLSTTGGKDKMEIRKYCAASFAQTRKKNPDNFPNLNKCLNNIIIIIHIHIYCTTFSSK